MNARLIGMIPGLGVLAMILAVVLSGQAAMPGTSRLLAVASSADATAEPRWTGATPTPLRTFHIDHARGDDSAAGTSRAAAWRHAPGDPQATGKPARFVPQPGDRIMFAANTRYFGNLVAPWQGSAARPIVIEGEGAGHSAIIDGSSQSATPRPCASQAECAGLANWRKLSVARFAAPLSPHAALSQGGGLLAAAQWPDPADPFYADETAQFAPAEGADLNAGSAPLPPALAAALAEPLGLRIAVWTLHNAVRELPVTGAFAGRLRFEPGEMRTYTDRPSRFALRGHPALISRAGEFAILPDLRTVVLRPAPGGGALFASEGRSGIDLAEARYVVVRGLGFENFADVPRKIRSGVPILAMRKGAGHIRITGNRFANLTLRQSMGAITLWDSADVLIEGNAITTVAHGSGMRLLRNTGLTIRDNAIARLGRTGIMLMSNTDTLVAGNRIHDVMGVHGNGFSAYLGNRRTRVVANSIWAANQPVTIHGNGTKFPAAQDILFARNLLVAPDDALGALISWGRQGQDIRLIGNVMLGGRKGALRLNRGDVSVTVEGNVLDGLIFGAAWPAGWSVHGNAFRKLGVLQARHQPADRVTLAYRPTGSGERPGDLAAYCATLATATELAALGGRDYRRAIGADFTCRTGSGIIAGGMGRAPARR